MASYPGSVWAPTTKNPGDKIASAHMNDAQNEIIAIEDGIRNGTAPLNSSGSTLATLSVSGGSTFAGNVVITGKLQSSNSSVNNLTVAGTFTSTRTSVMLTHSASQNVASASATGLSFDTESAMNGTMHSTASNSSRILFPVAGTYLIGANINWNPGSTAGTFRFVGIKVNDTTLLPGVQSPPLLSGTPAHGMHVSVMYQPASTTEYATVIVQQDSGSTMSIGSGVTAIRAFAALVGI